MRREIMLLAMLMAAPALAQEDRLLSPPSIDRQYIPGFDADRLPVGDDGPPEPEPVYRPAPPASPAEIAQWRATLIGRPAYSLDGRAVGTVTELTLDVDDRPLAAVVTIDSGARLPVPWRRVEVQLARPTLVVPWNAADLAWLSGR